MGAEGAPGFLNSRGTICKLKRLIVMGNYKARKALVLLAVLTLPVAGIADEWVPVTGEGQLRQLISDKTFSGTLKEGVSATAIYHADGRGELSAWGDVFPRQWRIEGEDRVCVLIEQEETCARIERSTTQANLYRGINDKGEVSEFQISDQAARIESQPINNEGAVGTPSAEELAAKLSNPTSPVMTIGNNFDYVSFKGDLPGAGDQSAFRYVFQTVFPLKLSNGGSVFFRPAIPVMFNEPVPDGQGGFSSEGTDIGDTGFDLSYGITTPGGLLWGLGMVGTIPTASNDKLGKDLWGLGPELLFGVIGKWGVVGGLLAHQWDIAGSGEQDIDVTSLSYFYAFPLGGGWQVAAGPSISYDHTRLSGDRWTIPAGIGIAKTTFIGTRPWKFQLQYWNYVKTADAFASEHQIRLSINPVVAAPWNEDR
jgi:hypothetical protein